MNFHGWIAGGLIILGASLWLVSKALHSGALQSPESRLLLAIYVVLVGQFGLALQNYHARVAQTLESEESRKADDQA